MIDTTRYLSRISLFFTILLYRRLLWRTGDIVKKIPITLYHRLILGERHDIFEKIFTGVFYCTVINYSLANTMYWPAATTRLSSQRNSCNDATKCSKHYYLDNHTYLQKCIHVSFVGINIHGTSVDYSLCGPERWMMDPGPLVYIYGTNFWSGDEKNWKNLVSRTAIL